MALIGLNYENSLNDFIRQAHRKNLVNALEIIPDSYAYFRTNELKKLLKDLNLPYVFHFISNSLASADFDKNNDLESFREMVSKTSPKYISDHLTCCRSGEIDLRQNISVPRTPDMIDLVVENIRQFKQKMGLKIPFLLENVALNEIGKKDELDPLFFYSEIVRKTDSFYLLDLHNLYADELNFGLDPYRFISGLATNRIREIHVAGGSWTKSKVAYLDSHLKKIPDRVFELLDFVLELSDPEIIIFERITNESLTRKEKDEITADLKTINEINEKWTRKRKKQS